MIVLAKFIEFLFIYPSITCEQIHHINEDTIMDMSKTKKYFTYKHYKLKETLNELITGGSYVI